MRICDAACSPARRTGRPWTDIYTTTHAYGSPVSRT